MFMFSLIFYFYLKRNEERRSIKEKWRTRGQEKNTPGTLSQKSFTIRIFTLCIINDGTSIGLNTGHNKVPANLGGNSHKRKYSL